MPRKLLFFSLNYAPEPTGFAPHTTALAEHLAAQGHDVTVVTGFPFAPRWNRWPGYRGKFVTYETMNGVQVVRVTHFIPRCPGSALQRMLMEASFDASAVAMLMPRLLARKRYDLVLYVGAQPAIAWLGRFIAALQNVPYIVKITDLAAQAAVDVGIVAQGVMARALDRVEFGAYRRARAAIVLCDAFKSALTARGFPATATHVIRDSVDLTAIRPGEDGSAFRRRHGISDDEFVVLYSGSLGLKQRLTLVVKSAEVMARESPDVRWVLVGEGETRDELEKEIASAKLADRVLLLPLQPAHEMSAMFAAADLLLLSQLETVKETVIPSKLLMYMAAGRPVLAAVNANSQAAALIAESRGGVVVHGENPRVLADAVFQLKGQGVALDRMGKLNRAYAEQFFDRSKILAAQRSVIEEVA